MIEISKNEAEFLLIHLVLPSHLRKPLTSIVAGKETTVSEDCADQIRDMVLDLYDLVGLDENYKITKIGKKLDDLVDKLLV